MVETPFGWVVAGNTSQVGTEAPRICHIRHPTGGDPESILGMRNLSQRDSVFGQGEAREGEKHYVSKTSRDATGSYVIVLPYNSNAKIILGSIQSNCRSPTPRNGTSVEA